MTATVTQPAPPPDPISPNISEAMRAWVYAVDAQPMFYPPNLTPGNDDYLLYNWEIPAVFQLLYDVIGAYSDAFLMCSYNDTDIFELLVLEKLDEFVRRDGHANRLKQTYPQFYREDGTYEHQLKDLIFAAGGWPVECREYERVSTLIKRMDHYNRLTDGGEMMRQLEWREKNIYKKILKPTTTVSDVEPAALAVALKTSAAPDRLYQELLTRALQAPKSPTTTLPPSLRLMSQVQAPSSKRALVVNANRVALPYAQWQPYLMERHIVDDPVTIVPAIQQIVPYVTLTRRSADGKLQVLTYTRGPDTGDARQQGCDAIGFGDHIENAPPFPTIQGLNQFLTHGLWEACMHYHLAACTVGFLTEKLPHAFALASNVAGQGQTNLPGGQGDQSVLRPFLFNEITEQLKQRNFLQLQTSDAERVHLGISIVLDTAQIAFLDSDSFVGSLGVVENVRWCDAASFEPGTQAYDKLEFWSKHVVTGLRLGEQFDAVA